MSVMPRIGWADIPPHLCLENDLSLHYKWEAFRFEWMGYGFMFVVRVKPES